MSFTLSPPGGDWKSGFWVVVKSSSLRLTLLPGPVAGVMFPEPGGGWNLDRCRLSVSLGSEQLPDS